MQKNFKNKPIKKPEQIKNIDLYNESKFKIFYFFKFGEIVAAVDADTQSEAVESLKAQRYRLSDFDYEMVYDKKSGNYTSSTYGYKQQKI